MATATLTTVNASTGSSGVAIAYDYSPYLERIATALESIASGTGTVSTALLSIASSTGTVSKFLGVISTATTAIATATTVLSGLGTTGTGIKTVGPFDYMESVYLFNWFLDQKMPLNTASITTTNFTNLVKDMNTLSNAFPRYL